MFRAHHLRNAEGEAARERGELKSSDLLGGKVHIGAKAMFSYIFLFGLDGRSSKGER